MYKINCNYIVTKNGGSSISKINKYPPPPPRKYKPYLDNKSFLSVKGFYLLAGILATLLFTACQCGNPVETKIDTASPTITNHSFSIMENVSTGTIVGVVNATDNDRITNYAITAGNTSNTFAISNNGLLTTANTIDYESISNYSLTIVVSDEGGETASNTTTVRVIDLDDTPPTITNHSFSIMENVSAGTIVGSSECHR